ncbi:MAG: ectoine synthase, partial [Planctomycetota bacterium]
MFIRTLDKIIGSENEVDGGNWVSRRILLAKDGFGFSLHDTVIRAGTETLIHYQNHLEAVYLIEGKGTVFTTEDEREWPV